MGYDSKGSLTGELKETATILTEEASEHIENGIFSTIFKLA